MISKTKTCLFIAIFSACIILDLILHFLHPSSTFHDLEVFSNSAANFFFSIFVFFASAFVLSNILHYCCSKVFGKKAGALKIGEALISQGLITEDQLKKALSEQRLRTGEILVKAGRLTEQQRDQALAIQRKKYRKIGQILRELGYSTEEDIPWALHMANRRIGRILKDMNLITDYDIDCALLLKTCRIDSKGKIISVG